MNRDKRVTVLLNADELRMLEERSRETGMSLSEVLRRGLSATPSDTSLPRDERTAEALERLATLRRRLGRRLDEVAHALVFDLGLGYVEVDEIFAALRVPARRGRPSDAEREEREAVLADACVERMLAVVNLP